MVLRTPVYLDHHATTPLDPRVMPLEAEAVAQAAMKSGVARVKREDGWVANHTERLLART